MDQEQISAPQETSVSEVPSKQVACPPPAVEAPKTADDETRGISLITAVVIAVLVSAIFSVGSVWLYDRYYSMKIVAVDIKGYIAKQRDDYVAGKISEEQLRKSFDNLETAIKAIPKNKIILMGDAVVRNVDVIKP